MSFIEEQQLWQKRVDAKLEDNINQLDDHAKPLKEAMAYALLNGGKRMRPFLVYAVGEMLGVEEAELDIPAQAVECIHAYSLVHDDLPAMDDDDLRRGKPTCHIAFDEATAILAGDALQTLAFDIIANGDIASNSDRKKVHLVRLLSDASGYGGMCGGQAIDLDSTGKSISLEELERLHNKKTGALLKVSVAMACALSENLSDEDKQTLYKFADLIGLAFQVRDDILDVIGDSDTLGKPQGSDIALAKNTYPALMGLGDAQAFLKDLHQQALQALAALPYNTQVLASFADFNVQRNH